MAQKPEYRDALWHGCGAMFLVVTFLGACTPARAQSLAGISRISIDVVLSDGEGTGAAAGKVLAKYFDVLDLTLKTSVEFRLRQAGLI